MEVRENDVGEAGPRSSSFWRSVLKLWKSKVSWWKRLSNSGHERSVKEDKKK